MNKYKLIRLKMETSDCENLIPTLNITRSDSLGDPVDDDSPKTPKFSPPYKRIRALRLFNNDAHHNPKALRNSSSCSTSLYSKFLQVSPSLDGSRNEQNITSAESHHDNSFNTSLNRSRDLSLPSVNINPFSPEGVQLSASQKRSYQQLSLLHNGSPELNTSRTSENSLELDISNNSTSSCNRRELRSSNISRYHEEFHYVELIGTGQFASVYKCINRLDGCVYAVKKSTRAVVGGAAANLALKEVYAHAVLGRHPHVVRYYSAWLENDHMIIQNEYCNGGSLQDKLTAMGHLEMWDLRKLLRQVAEGLRFIHASGLVHLDIKPSNIFVSRERRCMQYVDPYDSADDTELQDSKQEEEVEVYKIGDLGHVASTRAAVGATNGGGAHNIEEGDCRYLALEILREDYTLLPASDIFSLGITTLEAAGICTPLPKGGQEWHKLRSGVQYQVPEHLTLPTTLVQLIWQMMQPEKERRPTAACIVQNSAVQPEGCKSRAQLYRELNAEKVKNDFLQKQVLEVTRRQSSRGQQQQQQQCVVGVSGRLIGGKHVHKAAVCRSNSTTNF